MKNDYEYLILGAGPAGLQLAYYFERDGIDYQILEGGSKAGAFFDVHPRHRKLISINKVYNGTDEFNLNRGVGRIKGTAWIDTDGNLGIAGHRDGFFRPLKDIGVGDRMVLQTAGGTVTYEVSSIEIVEPTKPLGSRIVTRST